MFIYVCALYFAFYYGKYFAFYFAIYFAFYYVFESEIHHFVFIRASFSALLVDDTASLYEFVPRLDECGFSTH